MNIRLFLIIVSFTACVHLLASDKDTCSYEPESIDYCAIEGTAIDNLIDTAITCIGTPYKYGGTTKEGFDCSGFLGFVFQSYCGDLPRSSTAISKIGHQIERKEIQKGDLIFFKGRNLSSTSIGHVSFVTEVCEGKIKMIHATRRGVIEDVLEEINYYDARYLFAIRLDFPEILGLY